MPRRLSISSYRLHRQSGQAVVTLTDLAGRCRDVLPGKHGTPECQAQYLRVVQEWQARGPTHSSTAAAGDVTVNELILAYFRHAEQHYRHTDG